MTGVQTSALPISVAHILARCAGMRHRPVAAARALAVMLPGAEAERWRDAGGALDRNAGDAADRLAIGRNEQAVARSEIDGAEIAAVGAVIGQLPVDDAAAGQRDRRIDGAGDVGLRRRAGSGSGDLCSAHPACHGIFKNMNLFPNRITLNVAKASLAISNVDFWT